VSADAYSRIALIRFNAARFSSARAWQSYPTVTPDFVDRCGRVLSPLDGLLPPDTEVTFRVVLPPVSGYQRASRLHVYGLVQAAAARAAACRADAERLVPKVAQCRQDLAAAEAARDHAVSAAAAEMSALNKDLAKQKRGREHDRLKGLLAEVEGRTAASDAQVARTRSALNACAEELDALTRAVQPAEAQLRRYKDEYAALEAYADTRRPLSVQLAIDDRRVMLVPETAQNAAAATTDATTVNAAGAGAASPRSDDAAEAQYVYSIRVRTPKRDGAAVTIYVAGAAAVIYSVRARPPHVTTAAVRPISGILALPDAGLPSQQFARRAVNTVIV
jgi:hypothetical protein